MPLHFASIDLFHFFSITEHKSTCNITEADEQSRNTASSLPDIQVQKGNTNLYILAAD